MKKSIIKIICILGIFISIFAINALADGTLTSNASHGEVIFTPNFQVKNNLGKFVLVKLPGGTGNYTYQMLTCINDYYLVNYYFSTSDYFACINVLSNNNIAEPNSTDYSKCEMYYIDDTGTIYTPCNSPSGNKISVNATGLNIYSNADINYPNSDWTQFGFFFKLPVPPYQQVVSIANQHGGLISQGAFQTSSIVLVTGCSLLAILLGISLIPRVVHSFL